jgi:hypothetical protein
MIYLRASSAPKMIVSQHCVRLGNLLTSERPIGAQQKQLSTHSQPCLPAEREEGRGTSCWCHTWPFSSCCCNYPTSPERADVFLRQDPSQLSRLPQLFLYQFDYRRDLFPCPGNQTSEWLPKILRNRRRCESTSSRAMTGSLRITRSGRTR